MSDAWTAHRELVLIHKTSGDPLKNPPIAIRFYRKKRVERNEKNRALNFNFCSVAKDYISTKFDLKNILINIEKLLDIEIPFKKRDHKLRSKSQFTKLVNEISGKLRTWK